MLCKDITELLITQLQNYFRKRRSPMENNIVLEKSFDFALRIVKLYRYLVDVKKEYVLSKELLVAGTNVGRHVKEAVYAGDVCDRVWCCPAKVGGYGILAAAPAL